MAAMDDASTAPRPSTYKRVEGTLTVGQMVARLQHLPQDLPVVTEDQAWGEVDVRGADVFDSELYGTRVIIG